MPCGSLWAAYTGQALKRHWNRRYPYRTVLVLLLPLMLPLYLSLHSHRGIVQGFMDGAVESGKRAAAEVLQLMDSDGDEEGKPTNG